MVLLFWLMVNHHSSDRKGSSYKGHIFIYQIKKALLKFLCCVFINMEQVLCYIALKDISTSQFCCAWQEAGTDGNPNMGADTPRIGADRGKAPVRHVWYMVTAMLKLHILSPQRWVWGQDLFRLILPWIPRVQDWVIFVCAVSPEATFDSMTIKWMASVRQLNRHSSPMSEWICLLLRAVSNHVATQSSQDRLSIKCQYLGHVMYSAFSKWMML